MFPQGVAILNEGEPYDTRWPAKKSLQRAQNQVFMW